MNTLKMLFAWILMLLGTNLHAQSTYHNFENFKEAVAAAQPGDEIVLAAGRYEAEPVTMKDVAGTKENPVIIRAEFIGADTLDAGTYFDLRHCSHVIIQGFVIHITENATTFKIQTCNNIRITQNILDGAGESYYTDDGVSRNSSVWVSIQSLWDDPVGLSHHNRIDHNLFRNKQTLGNMIRIDGTNEIYVSQHDVIEYNHFKNMGPRAENEMEAIRIGWSAMSESDGFCTVSNNLFEECNGDPEIISVKCNKNILSHNTFLRCQGTLSLRHGNESLVEGNFFMGQGAEGTGGLRIYGSDHRIINNYFEGLSGNTWDAPITLTYGDADEGSGSLTNHFRIERAVIANNTLVNNTHGIEVGYDNQGKYSKPPRDVVLAYNLVSAQTGTLATYINPPDNMSWINNLFYAQGDAVIGEGVTFTTDEVLEADPLLKLNAEYELYKASVNTATYVPASEAVGMVERDMDGQLRSSPTNYGADEYNSGQVAFYPLSPSEVGPQLGDYLNLSLSEMTFLVAGGEERVSISSNLDWDVSSDPDWITVEPLSGSGEDSITVTVAANSTGLPRSGTLSIESSNASEGVQILKVVLVNQLESDPPVLDISESSLSFSSVAGSSALSVSSNVSWTASVDAGWISLAPESGSDNGSLTISVEENPSRSSRKGSVTITDGETLNRMVEIDQEGSVGSEVKLTIVDAVASTEESSKGNIADNVYDGNLENRWSGEGDGAFITLDLGHNNTVSFLKVGLYKGDTRHSYFDVETSVDGMDFFPALTGVTTEITSDLLVIYDFADTTARYVRIIGHGNSSSAWNSYTEFEAWGWFLDHTSFNEPEQILAANIFPNPSTGSVTISGMPGAHLTICDLSGRVLLRKDHLVENEILHTGLGCGIYVLYLESGDLTQVEKLIIK